MIFFIPFRTCSKLRVFVLLMAIHKVTRTMEKSLSEQMRRIAGQLGFKTKKNTESKERGQTRRCSVCGQVEKGKGSKKRLLSHMKREHGVIAKSKRRKRKRPDKSAFTRRTGIHSDLRPRKRTKIDGSPGTGFEEGAKAPGSNLIKIDK